MDEQTAELRDVFLEATGTETVTEGQIESRGSLTDRDADVVAKRLAELIATMRDRDGFSTDLDDETYARIARGHLEAAATDEEIAADLSLDADTVRTARLDLHLVDDADRDAPFAYERLTRLVDEGRSAAACAAELDVDVTTVERYVPVVRADLASTRVSDRFRDEFHELLTDAAIEGSYATSAREDGLRDATEDIETDVSL
ncbi:hypothetical protein [Halorubrum vacuolatum]|uniref:Conditioned medium-induced protein 4 n=1 Tax=Halorubrum vacuolatum TaxID=63740 RepID=A0A238WAQ5_HALVU|nr:hypothetical protein [Halorubrum vacuolatum]SNR43675.1 hypothetical protein SAMN06264855_106119 [Halorubrum vacuolatum]